MNWTLVELLKSLPGEELRALVTTTLERRQDLPDEARERLNNALDASIEVKGFRKSHGAPTKALIPKVVAACVEPDSHLLAASLMLAWGRRKDAATEHALAIVQEEDIEPSQFPDLLRPLACWETGRLQLLASELMQRAPELTQVQASLLLCACAARHADLGKLDPLPPAQPLVEAGLPSSLGPLWHRALLEARSLPPEAPEWTSLEAFTTQLAGLAAAKQVEAKAAQGLAELAEAMAQLGAVPPSVISFFDLASSVAAWSAPGAGWQSVSNAAARLQEVTSSLSRAEPLLRPAANIAERRRQDEQLEALAEALKSATLAVDAVLAAPQVLETSEPSTPPVPGSSLEVAEAAVPVEPLGDLVPESVTEPDPSYMFDGSEEIRAREDGLPSAVVESTAPQDVTELESHPQPATTPDARADHEPVPGALAPPPAPELPRHLKSYAEFSSAFWTAPSGRCEEIPWKAEPFVARLASASSDAMGQQQLLRLWIVSRALEELGAEPAASAADVRALAELLSSPTSPTSGSYPDRSSLLREAEPLSNPARRIELFLEAVRPSRETPLNFERARALVEGAAYRDTPLRNVILALLRLGSMGIDPVPRLLASLASDAAAAEHSPRRLEELRVQFHKEVVPLWNAAGAKIPRKHCRDAWNLFIEQVAPTLRELFPLAKGGAAEWDTAEMRRKIGALVRLHEEIADAADARFDDRTKMDRAARRIADLAMEVNDVAAALRDQGHQAGRDVVPVEAVRALVGNKVLETPDEELCRRVLVSLATGTPGGAPLGVTLGSLIRYPDLLSAMHSIAIESATSQDTLVASVDAIDDPIPAAAVLLYDPQEPVADGTPATRQLLRLLAAPHRRWLLSRLGAGAGLVLPKTARLDDEVAVFEEIDRLQASWSFLDELASRARDQVRGVLKEVRDRAAQPIPDLDPTLCMDWLRRVRDFAERCRDTLLLYLQSRARVENRVAADAALKEGRLGDALHLLQEAPREAAAAPSLRETPWRGEARSRYPNPLEVIARESGDIFERWRKGITGNVVGADRQLRGLFVDEIMAGADKKWNHAKEHVIPSGELRQFLKPYNPTYLPQLAKFGSLIIVTAPINPKQTNFEHATAGIIDKLGRENLYAVLAPLLSENGRQATLKEFRRRGLAAAVVDDLDLCRILNLGGRRPSALIALLEIVLEQQAWSTHFTPFAMHDGQHAQVEMYVGRSVEAEQLTQTQAYSRLFSGRKLGKSALVRYVHDTRDGLKLPSGNTLRVLFVPAVGAESDLDIVGRFAEELSERFGFKVPGLLLDGHPGDALVQIARTFVETHPAESLLVIFDEADKFVEAQLEAYDRDREGCLSFRMRTQVESFRDRANLPRIRFVFAGYRATSTAEGAWANWGDVLRLKPLSLDEGARLIAGPLARMGIDASGQATAIAHRCGCQPVVLLRFGELLLKHLEGRYAPTQREHVVVSAADVAAVFNEESVREEIRVVVRNNFQDSARARVVFGALLGVFAEHAPGDGIPDADRLVIERLRAIDGDLAWLHPAPEAQILEVQRLLKDFAARELLLMRRGADGQPACYLRFPHHLSILLPQDPEGAIREDIAALRRRGKGVLGEAPRALVAARELDLLREAACRVTDPRFRIKAAIVGSHWPEAATHRSGGFADRLGIPPDAVFTSTKADRGLARDRMAVVNPTADVVERISSKRASHQPAPLFIGGADVLRWALDQQFQTQDMFEISGLRRVSAPILDWWFGKVRALSFEDLDWRERILGVTFGVPLLLGEFEHTLLNDTVGGVEIGRARLAQAIQATADAVPRLARSLEAGEPAVRLSPREIAILRMLAHVGAKTEFKASMPSEDLTEFWDDLYRSTLDLQAIDPTKRADRVAVAVLVVLGLVPTGGADRDEDPLRRLVIPPKEDVLYLLAAGLAS